MLKIILNKILLKNDNKFENLFIIKSIKRDFYIKIFINKKKQKLHTKIFAQKFYFV